MKRMLCLLVTTCFLFATSALAADLKVGYVDLQRALNQSKAGSSAKQQISGKVKEYENTIEAQQKELKKLKEELEKQAMLLSDDARAAKERDYQKKLKDFQRFTKDIQEELQQKDADFTRQILESLFEVLKDLGKKEGFTLILEKSESSVLYADDSIDLTEKLIKAFDAKYSKI